MTVLRPISCALVSAALFGASTPLAKLLIGQIDPWLLAGLLYLGAGIGLVMFRLLSDRHLLGAPIRRADLPWLGLIVLAGGIVGPVLLMTGLATTPAAPATLLLNLEGVATLGIAWLVFRENADRRILIGAAAILAGAIMLSWQPGQDAGLGLGGLAIAGACLAWGIDNNLTRKLSAADPVQIASIKGLVAGSINVAIAAGQGAAMPAFGPIATAAVLGLVGYGISLVLFILALRDLGTARTGAYFSTAPFVGAVLGLALFAEAPSIALVVAGALMALGVYLHVTERHEHQHVHEAMTHEHRHVHDEHHQHAHAPGIPAGEPHSHVHSHARLIHRHPHYPDLHHRHDH